MINFKDIYWLSGLLEGEGCFAITVHKKKSTIKYKSGVRYSITPRVIMSSTDLDIVKRAASILGATNLSTQKRLATKNYHTASIYGVNAIGWMMTLYPMMGIRRKAKIKSIINSWRCNFNNLKTSNA